MLCRVCLFTNSQGYWARLKDIDEHSRAEKSNITIASSLQNLIKQTAEDIMNCAIACRAYANTTPLMRKQQRQSWSEQFKKYIECFSSRRRLFLLALVYVPPKTIVPMAPLAQCALDDKYPARQKLSMQGMEEVGVSVVSGCTGKWTRRKLTCG